jgi:hypothetical protein
MINRMQKLEVVDIYWRKWISNQTRWYIYKTCDKCTISFLVRLQSLCTFAWNTFQKQQNKKMRQTPKINSTIHNPTLQNGSDTQTSRMTQKSRQNMRTESNANDSDVQSSRQNPSTVSVVTNQSTQKDFEIDDAFKTCGLFGFFQTKKDKRAERLHAKQRELECAATRRCSTRWISMCSRNP